MHISRNTASYSLWHQLIIKGRLRQLHVDAATVTFAIAPKVLLSRGPPGSTTPKDSGDRLFRRSISRAKVLSIKLFGYRGRSVTRGKRALRLCKKWLVRTGGAEIFLGSSPFFALISLKLRTRRLGFRCSFFRHWLLKLWQ